METGVLGNTSPQGAPLKAHPDANDSSECLSLGTGRGYDEHRSGSPELVMLWDVDETNLQVEDSQAAMADQAQGPRSRFVTKFSPPLVPNTMAVSGRDSMQTLYRADGARMMCANIHFRHCRRGGGLYGT